MLFISVVRKLLRPLKAVTPALRCYGQARKNEPHT